MKGIFRVERMWRPRGELRRRYDVVIVGGGSHGLATAYYLAKNHGITDVAVLEQSYIGSGAAGRNTTIIRALYHRPGGIIRHDAVVWGLARGADRRGVEIHPYTKVLAIEQSNGRVTGVLTTRGDVDGGLVDAGRRYGRRAPADHDAHLAGLRDGAAEAVPRRGHRLLPDARLHLADGPRRVPDRCRDRAVHDLPGNEHVPLPRGLRPAHARALPAAREREGAAPVDGAL